MKNLTKPLLFFFAGIALMAILQLLTQCNKDDDFFKDSINSAEINNQIDYKAIDKAADEFQDAFKDANQELIDELSMEETVELKASLNEYYSAEELTEIGKAMRKSKRISATGNYAEFEYTIDGATFSFAMAMNDEGVWKLMRY